MTKVSTKLEKLNASDSSFSLTYGQLTALATTPVGQTVGLGAMIDEEDRLVVEAIHQQANMHDLEESMLYTSTFSSNNKNNMKGSMNWENSNNNNSQSLTQEKYLEHVKQLQKENTVLKEKNVDLERKYKKYYKFTLDHLNKNKDDKSSISSLSSK